MSVAILIPVHNRRELTLACLRHLATTGDLARHRVIVIDAGSTDGTSESVRTGFPTVHVVRGPPTWWWTAAIAAGMRHAFEQGASGVIWLNDDVRPGPDVLSRLVQFGRDHPRTIAAPVCHHATGAILPTAFRGRHIVNTSAGTIVNVDGVSGFCVWVPRAVWERIGAPDARRFPHYYGDTAYMVLATRAGCDIALLPELSVQVLDAHPRATTVREFRRRLTGRSGAWRATFVHEKSPFRLTTQWHYLRLRYGSVLGSVLAAARFASWQAEYATSEGQREP